MLNKGNGLRIRLGGNGLRQKQRFVEAGLQPLIWSPSAMQESDTERQWLCWRHHWGCERRQCSNIPLAERLESSTVPSVQGRFKH